MELNRLTIKEASELLDNNQTSSVEITRACLSYIKKIDSKVKACLLVDESGALAQAKLADERRRQGEKGYLLGIPCLIKDNILTKGLKTTASSKILENYLAPYDATVIERLRAAGAVILGKTNLDEFAHGASTENSAFGVTHNPWDLNRVPGGSSGGSAAAVAADMAIFALGSDTGGSIRQPASFCGLTGLKPSYGRVSRFGLISMTSSTDVIGPLTKTVEDAALVLQTIAGGDEKEATSDPAQVEDYVKGLGKKIKGLKLGIVPEYISELDGEIKQIMETALEEFKKLGAEIVPIELPYTKHGVATYYIITPAELSSNLARFDGVRFGFSQTEAKDIHDFYLRNRSAFGSEAKRRIILGTYVLSAGHYDAYYKQAQRVRLAIIKEYEEAFRKVDVIALPTSPHIAFKIGEQSDDPLKMYLEDIFLSAPSLAGLPAISIPAGFSQGMPVGLQLVAKKLGEGILLGVANGYQQATDWHKQKPSV